MNLLKHFSRVYIVNLPFKEERRRRIESHLAEIGLADSQDITWMKAICGNHCPPPAWFHAGPGAWGCLQSHRRILEDAIMDELESYCVLEDDAIFNPHSKFILDRLMEGVPQDWGQIYLGGQHLSPPHALEGNSSIVRCSNVNRTHAFAVNRRAFQKIYQHISHAPDYIKEGAWHIDHQLGLAHERQDWQTYAPAWWLAGQEEGTSNVSNNLKPRMWWHSWDFVEKLPFIWLPSTFNYSTQTSLDDCVHFGNNLRDSTKQDVGLDACIDSDDALLDWLKMISREALDRGMLPGISHPAISLDRINSVWKSGALIATDVDLKSLNDYPINGLFSPPIVSGQESCESSAA